MRHGTEFALEMKRRTLLVSAVATAAIAELPGCGGTDSGSVAPTALSGPVAWNPGALLFLAGSFSSIDLAQTLPLGVRRGGVFSLAAGSSPLPAQLSLSPDGFLLAAEAPVSTTANIVFTYQQPG